MFRILILEMDLPLIYKDKKSRTMKHSYSVILFSFLSKLSLHLIDSWIVSTNQYLLRHRPSSRLAFSPSSDDVLNEKPSCNIISVNYHISRQCNYHCKFCFHTRTNSNVLSLEKAKKGLKLLQQAGIKKINFAGKILSSA